MIKKILCIVILFLTTGSIATHSATTVETETKIEAALDALYNDELEVSRQLFKEVLADHFFHPMAPLGVIATDWLICLEHDGYIISNTELLKNVNKTLEIYEAQIEQNPSDYALLLYYGSTKGLKARVLFARKDWLGVLITGYQSLKYIKYALEFCPDLIDAYLPIGILNYYSSISSPYIRIASWILAESASKDEALKQIELVAQNGVYAKYEAKSLLALIYLYMEEDFVSSLDYSAFMAEKFAQNPYYHFLAAEAAIALSDFELAEQHIQAIKTIIPELKGYILTENTIKLQLLEGTLALYQSDLQNAVSKLTSVINSYALEFDWHLSYAHLRLGQLYDIKGERQAAITNYKAVLKLDKRISAYKWAKHYLQQPFQIE